MTNGQKKLDMAEKFAPKRR